LDPDRQLPAHRPAGHRRRPRPAPRRPVKPRSRLGPPLVAVCGLGLIGAGLFLADPALGFPPGTPPDAHAISWHRLHIVSGAVGFLALIAACVVFAQRFRRRHELGWATYSLLTGLVFLAGFVGIATGSGDSATILGFWLALVLAWSWLTALTLRVLIELAPGGVPTLAGDRRSA
jgi:hypothetical protein